MLHKYQEMHVNMSERFIGSKDQIKWWHIKAYEDKGKESYRLPFTRWIDQELMIGDWLCIDEYGQRRAIANEVFQNIEGMTRWKISRSGLMQMMQSS